MKNLFISSKTPESIKSMLKNIGFSLVMLPPEPSLPEPVSSHADMLIFENIVQKDYYFSNKDLFEGYNVTLTDEKFGTEYPKDILLNAFVFKDTVFGRSDAISIEIIKLYPKVANLRQGYAKCSTLLFGDNAVTADRNIADTLTEHGCNVLLIQPGHISLPGYDYGFIGGASFVYDNKVIFFGNIEEHPDYIKIRDFIGEAGYEIIYKKNTPLTDLGSAVVLTKDA